MSKQCSCKGIKEKVNANRQVPVFNPSFKTHDVKPKIDKSPKGKIGGTGNPQNQDMWKKILDSQLRRNVKETSY